MIKDPVLVKKFEDAFIRDEGKLNFDSSMQLFASMWNEAVRFGVFPPKDPLEGIDVDVRVAKVLNSCLKESSP